MEQALLQAEKQAEREQAQAENDTLSQLQLKLGQLDTSTQKEKEKVGPETETGQLRASACLFVFESKQKNPSFLTVVASDRFLYVSNLTILGYQHAPADVSSMFLSNLCNTRLSCQRNLHLQAFNTSASSA